MRVYEELFIVRPEATDEEIDPFIEQMKLVITSGGGAIEKADKWGVRKLAYRVKKKAEGHFILLQFSAGPELVLELERRLRVADMVLKFITVRIDEKLKRIEKRKKARDKRAARKPAPQPASVAPASPLAPAMPAEVPSGPTPGAPAPGAPAPAPPAPDAEPSNAEPSNAEPSNAEPSNAEPSNEEMNHA